jgi:hypothetical protein
MFETRRRLLCLAVVCSAACASPPSLSNSQSSPERLGREVLAALGRGDEATLRGLAITEGEFKLHVWPQLPAARAGRNLPASYVWGELTQKSEANLETLLASHRGRRFELVGVRFDGATTDHGSYRVHRNTVFLVLDSSGRTELRVCGSLIQKDGGWKVFSYVVDD